MKILRKSTVTISTCFLRKEGLEKMKDFLEALAIVTVIVFVLCLFIPSKGTAPVNTNGVQTTEGVIVYRYVNVRTEASTASDDTIIGQLHFGDTVPIVAVGDEWTQIEFEGKEAYIINESVCSKWIMIDLSDFNWGKEYDSIKEFKAFIERANGSTKFAGCYIQVQRTFKENKHWKEITAALDEMKVPYGLYLYSSAKTQEDAAKEYENYLKLIDGVELKYNKYPFMVDLEGRGNQTEVIKYYNGILDDYVLYASASDMSYYGYYKLAKNYWIAHYGLCQVLPTKEYVEYDDAYTVLDNAVMWQVTSKGHEVLFGTKHLDVNVVSDEWIERYMAQ
jgi:uncharacterized protein YgiM (DUF1202 family)